MKYKTNLIFGKVNWKYYLDPSVNKNANNFLKISGKEVLTQLHNNIKKCIKNNNNQLEILLHPNVSSVTLIKKSEFKDVLSFILDWFMKIEEYELCTDVIETKKLLENKEKELVIEK